MKERLLAILCPLVLLGSFALPVALQCAQSEPAATVKQPWKRLEAFGRVKEHESNWWAARKSLMLQTPGSAPNEYLCFGSDEDFRECERLIDMVVQVRGVRVQHGGETWFLVETVQLTEGR